jgi:predicted RNase H-like nuclease
MKDLYRRAGDVNEELTGKRLSQQAFHISKKVREVDLLMTRALQDRVREVHPEVCFQALNGRQAMRNNKKKRPGVAERWALLRHLLPHFRRYR